MAAPKLAYTDAELDEYLRENEKIVTVQDAKNLPASFIQRLRDRLHNTSRSRPDDLDQVSARLLQVPPESQIEPLYSLSEEATRLLGLVDPSDKPSSTSSDAKEEGRQNVLYERVFHDELVRNGGRPWYPIHLLEEVSKNPREYTELLRAWQIFPEALPDDFEVYEGQFVRWVGFGEWQRKIRDEFEGRISEYTAWAKRLLAKHSFERPFEFDEDPKRQDKLTTWIEYMTNEVNFYNVRYAWYERRGKWYDEQWKRLADSGVLQPDETREFILNGKSSFQYTAEEAQARKALDSAHSALFSAHKAIFDPSQPSDLSSQAYAAAESKLDTARQSFESIKKRNDLVVEFCQETSNYRETESRAKRHSILLKWIQEQVPLIAAELGQLNTAESASDAGLGGRDDRAAEPRARKHSRDSITQDDRPTPKHPRRHVDPKADDNPSTSASATITSQDARATATVHMPSTDILGPTAEVPEGTPHAL